MECGNSDIENLTSHDHKQAETFLNANKNSKQHYNVKNNGKFINNNENEEIYNDHTKNNLKRSFQKTFENEKFEDTEIETPNKRYKLNNNSYDNLSKYKNNAAPLENFHITPKLFYTKNSNVKISNDLNSLFTKELPSISNESDTETISSKIRTLMTKEKMSRKNIRFKINKRYSKEPRLGNKSVNHKIKRPRQIRKVVKDDKKNKNKLEKKSYNDKSDVTQNSNKELNIIENNNKYDSSSDDTDDDILSLSDIENQSQNETTEIQENDNLSLGPKKFFKSKTKPIQNEFQVIRNVKATVFGGKIFVLSEKKKKERKSIRNHKFSKERAVVRDIIQKLSHPSESPPSHGNNEITEISNQSQIDNQIHLDNYESNVSTIIEKDTLFGLTDDKTFEHFRSRIPYNTTEPEVIERQHLLLDFLISHNICNEENFKIFIVDPENHKEKAAEIVDSLALVISTRENEDLNQNESNENHIFCDESNVIDIHREESTNDIIEKENNVFRIQNENILANNVITIAKIDIEEDDNVNEIHECVDQKIQNESVSKKLTDNISFTQIQNSTPSLNDEINTNDVQFTSLVNNDTYISDNQNKSLQDTSKNIEINRDSKNNSPKLFPIFYHDTAKPEVHEANQTKRKSTSLKANGINQYQIDAGQKEFGARQCPQCELLYTVHEPEEEKLHAEHHKSLQVLRFKGWVDENIVKKYPEWGSDGRVIYITDSSSVKHKKRLNDVIDIVDKELGFSSYIFPDKFVAYLAIKCNQIVGLCLVQPLKKASKYLCVNGVDCCSEELFDVKCGISRIWVSSLHRRMGIASKLVSAVQMCTIPGIEISLDQIAFSAPTENGKIFARKITKRNDFFVY